MPSIKAPSKKSVRKSVKATPKKTIKVRKTVKSVKTSPKASPKKTIKNRNTNKSIKASAKTSTNKFNIMTKIGILDPEGKAPNPLTGEPYENLHKEDTLEINGKEYPATYAVIAKKRWEHLPVYQKKEEVLKAMDKHQVLLGISGTGSGKSVLLPKFALHISNYKKKVLCCIPKKSSAESAAKFAAVCMDTPIGAGVGYYFKGKRETSDKTLLEFTTTGSLTSRLTGSPEAIDEYGTIILDEIHEASVQSIMCILLLKRIALKRKDLKIIFMSATVDVSMYEKYFPAPHFNFGSVDLGSKTTHTIKDLYLERPIGPHEVEEATTKKIIELLKNTDKGDILGFVKSGGEGRKICGLLTPECKKLGYNIFCTELESKSTKNKHKDSGIAKSEYALNALLYKQHPNMNKNNPPDRKIVLATNVAESSLTVEGIVYVIDTGLALESSYNPDEMARTLKDEYISKAAIQQRRGRAGRTQPGECHHLYTEQQYNSFNDFPIPDMQKTDLSSDMIDILRLDEIQNVGDLRKFLGELISPPEEKFVKAGLMILHGLDIITSMEDDGVGTPLGGAISMFRGVKPTHAKSIISAYFNYCKNEVVDIISAIILMDGRMEGLFIKYYKPKPGDPKGITESEHKKIMKQFVHKYGDHLSILKAINIFREKKQEQTDGVITGGDLKRWCKDNYLSYRVLDGIKRQAQEIGRAISKIRGNGKKRNIGNKQLGTIKPMELALNNGNNINSSNNINNTSIQEGGTFNNLEQFIPQNTNLKNKDDMILKSLLDGCYINVGLQTKKSSYITCFPPKKVEASVNRDTTLSVFGKICMYDELFVSNMGTKYNIVSKFPDTIIKHLNLNVKQLLIDCQSAKKIMPSRGHNKPAWGQKGQYGKKAHKGQKGKWGKKSQKKHKKSKGKWYKRV